MNVLIVDDEVGVLQSMRYALDRHFDVLTATCAKDGLNLLRSNSLDLIVLDVTMPDCDGIELLKQIRRQWPELPVLMLSADDTWKSAAIAAGANGWLAKPPELQELRSTISSIIDSD